MPGLHLSHHGYKLSDNFPDVLRLFNSKPEGCHDETGGFRADPASPLMQFNCNSNIVALGISGSGLSGFRPTLIPLGARCTRFWNTRHQAPFSNLIDGVDP